MRASPSSTCTLALSVSAVSSGVTGTLSWHTISPPSTSSTTWCTVHPLSLSPASITDWCTARSIRPACLGSSDGCTLIITPGQSWQNCADTMRMKPTSSTSSHPASLSALVTSASNSSRTRPFPGMCTAGMLFTRARCRMYADATLETTTLISAFSLLSAIAYRMGCSELPLVLPTTPTFTLRKSRMCCTRFMSTASVPISGLW
mmetsp:Transcript_56269/g.138051  ORF Transcript_56269/g.138051 Transcript_56269/m.138051 type:complete len:204 (+) Transcript_56269:305-916(+)